MPYPQVLIVPVRLAAMVVNNDTRQRRNYQRWQLDYDRLAQFASPEPPPFSGMNGEFQRSASSNGIYLHWELPTALRHGVDDGMGMMGMRLVPNRWWVVRMRVRAGVTAYTAWVVESDYANANDGTSSYLLEGSTTGTRIGRKIALPPGQSYQPATPQAQFLRAVAPSEPMFAAFQPYCEDVFSAHDPATDLQDQDQVSYMVLGWYTDRGSDPLAGVDSPEQMADRLGQLGWEVDASTVQQGEYANQSRYEGMVYDITWATSGLAGTEALQWPLDQSKVAVGIGNSAVDALTAFARSALGAEGTATEALLIEAFQYGLLGTVSEPGGLAALDAKIHSAWFEQFAGGYRWALDKLPADNPDTLPPLPDARQLAAALQAAASLNVLQSQLDEALRTMASQQVALYEVYWKQGYSATLGYPLVNAGYYQDQLDPNYTGGIVNQLVATMRQVDALAAQVPGGADPDALQASLAAYLYAQGVAIPDGFALRRYALPAFAAPNDPVLMVAGINAAGLLEDESLLPCRYANALVQSGSVGATPIPDRSNGSGLSLQYLPAESQAVLREFSILDPALAQGGTATYDHTFPQWFQQPWAQPWNPLFLEWEVNYFPIAYSQSGTDNWGFDGAEFSWQGPGHGEGGAFVRADGRIFLSPQSVYNFRSKLEEYLANHPDTGLAHLRDALTQVRGWDFLSQSLDGLHAQLTCRDPEISTLPETTATVALGQTLGQLMGVVPKNPVLMGLPDGTLATSAFQPMRAGQMVLTRLFVVDRFGQAVQLVNAQNVQQLQVYRGHQMDPATPLNPSAAQRIIEMQPRLLQPARLDFELLNLDGGLHWMSPTQNPLRGWLISNTLSNSLDAYSPTGLALGQLVVAVTTGGEPTVQWLPAPTADGLAWDDMATQYPPLAKVLAPMLLLPADGFHAFTTLLDRGLWRMNPAGDGYEAGVSALCGRPLALVDAALSITLGGLPLADPTWPNMMSPQANPVLQQAFRIALGSDLDSQDGLLGYFAQGDYQQFNVVDWEADVPGLQAAGGYLRPIGGDNYLRQSIAGDPVTATLLLDPRGSVQARTGILPVSRLRLPKDYVSLAMRQLQLYFRMGPLLSTVETMEDGGAGQRRILLPQPRETTRAWSWMGALTYDPTRILPIAGIDQGARMSNVQLVLRNGTLTLEQAFADGQPPAD